MKKLILILLIAAITLVATARAQTNLPVVPSPSGTFINTVESYFTSFNTNLDGTFTNKGSFWTGVDSIQGGNVPLANSLGLSYKIYDHLGAECVVRNGGVSGTIISTQIGIELKFVVHDLQAMIYADGGYDMFDNPPSKFSNRLFGEIGADFRKALTDHTFAGARLGLQIPRNSQVFTLLVGFQW